MVSVKRIKMQVDEVGKGGEIEVRYTINVSENEMTRSVEEVIKESFYILHTQENEVFANRMTESVQGIIGKTKDEY